ncbi:stalk domain-containing protein [Cohnella hashimotonis]|uniref:Copper amine oxidase-like N-terminal domain-containing protein n=1 Tax=Cohnella hashimotonis TaxID=2826895 RepID=A0ABT6TKQ3_9BACL|nr:hypothetical protein [Cohnella hashimotonis]MDI4647411.1 hypothetical protein [Cohnella hashimotonis]
MKQSIKYVSIFLAGAIFATASSAYGASAVQMIKASIRGDLKIQVNGKALDAQPISYNNSTYLPLRKAGEAIGGQVSISGNTISIVSNSKSLSSGTATATVGSSDVWYSSTEVGAYLKNTYDIIIASSTSGSDVFMNYNGTKYPTKRDINYFYDLESSTSYYSESFWLQFLKKSDLESLHKFKINIKSRIVTPI